LKPVCGLRCYAEVTLRLTVRETGNYILQVQKKRRYDQSKVTTKTNNLTSKVEHMLHSTL